MAPTTPYTPALGARDPIEAMKETPARIERLTAGWTAQQFERSYAPGKWTARLILTHLAQTELVLGARARMALATPGYTSQSFEQDAWLEREQLLSGRDAVQALVALSRMNVVLFGGLSEADRAVPFTHHEYGSISVDWIIHQMAGHQIHHLKQLEAIRG